MHVIIVGGGFAGVRAALKLANKRHVDVKLLVSQSYFEYHAALYRSATGRSPLEVAIPLRDFFSYARNIEVIEDKVTDLRAADHQITGESGTVYEYDVLLMALGNITDFYGIKGLDKYSYGVKTIHQALRLKRHLHEQLLNHETERNFVVIGAGATGVELSAELAAYISRIRRKHKLNTPFKMQLIEAATRPLPAMPESYTNMIERRLKTMKVKLITDTPVKSETADSILLPSGPIQSHTVIWTAGVTNNPFFAAYPQIFQLGKNQRVQVNNQLAAAPDIYVLGDSADTTHSGMAQTALHDANFVTANLLRFLKHKQPRTYQPKRPIYAIPVGPRWASVLWGRLQIHGRLGWALRRLADFRLYLNFLPITKALVTWRYGSTDEEICPICRQ